MSLLLFLSVAAGCAPPVRPAAFTPRERVPLAGLPTGMAGWPPAQWWRRYHDPQLNRLMALAMRDSPDMQVAEARYRSAERAVDAQEAKLRPKVQGLVDATHGYSDVEAQGQVPQTGSTSSGVQSGQGFDLQPGSSWSNTGVAGAMLSWDLDLWGKQKAAVAAAVGTARAAEADRAAAANSLQYNLAHTYFDWQGLQARKALADQAEHSADRYRQLISLRVHAGLDDPQNLDKADTQLAEQRRNLAMLSGATELDAVQLAALAGVSPAELGTLKPRPLPQVETQLPRNARLGLIARRPDIVASRWQIEASLRSIDEARAAYYPDVSLMALGAYLRAYPQLGSGTRTDLALGSIGPSISLPIFSGGRLKAQLESSQAQLDAAVANYNRTIVQAAQSVAQQVVSLRQQSSVLVQLDHEVQAGTAQLRRTQDQRREGLIDDRSYLKARLQLDQQRDARLQLRSQMLGTHLALIHALGGGYHVGHLPSLPAGPAKDTYR